MKWNSNGHAFWVKIMTITLSQLTVVLMLTGFDAALARISEILARAFDCMDECAVAYPVVSVTAFLLKTSSPGGGFVFSQCRRTRSS